MIVNVQNLLPHTTLENGLLHCQIGKASLKWSCAAKSRINKWIVNFYSQQDLFSPEESISSLTKMVLIGVAADYNVVGGGPVNMGITFEEGRTILPC